MSYRAQICNFKSKLTQKELKKTNQKSNMQNANYIVSLKIIGSHIYMRIMNGFISTQPINKLPLKGETCMYVNNEGNQKKYISCPHCGEQILMVPVLADMIQAIENHLETHKEGSYSTHDPIQHPKAPAISEDLGLPEQVLIRAAEIGETLTREPDFTLRPTDRMQ
jgi:DNA-directed RNA polymerase subunit RPC12/RpoP